MSVELGKEKDLRILYQKIMEPGDERAIGEWEEAKFGISSAHGESCGEFQDQH